MGIRCSNILYEPVFILEAHLQLDSGNTLFCGQEWNVGCFGLRNSPPLDFLAGLEFLLITDLETWSLGLWDFFDGEGDFLTYIKHNFVFDG